MGQPVIQTSFNGGEWAPSLYARVDLQKYHSGAALLENFFVDYRGGATIRPGTKYIATSQNNGSFPPRLISFQASLTVSYVLEFGVLNGVGYIAFYNAGAQVLSGGLPYTIASPYASSELRAIKFVQNVNEMILCHPNHPPQLLTLVSATNWTIAPITFGATISPPATPATTSTLASGTAVFYAYVVTSVDVNGQESDPSAFSSFGSTSDIRTVAGTNTITWVAVTGAVSYNIYRAVPRYGSAVPAGSDFGFVGNVTGTTFIDSNITPDFTQSPPIAQNPFSGSGVQNINLTAGGSGFNAVPTITIGNPPSGVTATAGAILHVLSVSVASGGYGYTVGDILSTFYAVGLSVQVASVGLGATVTSVNIWTNTNVLSGPVSTVALPTVIAAGPPGGIGCTINVVWTVSALQLFSSGSGYVVAPGVTFTGGSPSVNASATTTLGAASSGNPSVPALQQQRLILAGPPGSPQQFNGSQPGSFFNFDTTDPVQADNAFQGTLVAGQLNTIQAMISQPQGLIILSDKQAWLLNGGSPGSPLDATAPVANPQAYNGASGVPPIVANDNILYVQAKGSIVRDLVFNYYTQVYTGTDISVLSSHLFYGFTILEWAWAEEPFKLVWAVRNDGTMLTLTFLKEQELIAWAHSTTQGLFSSVATVVESTLTAGTVDAIYTVVQRTINGATVQYIERVAEQVYTGGLASSWVVDAGISFSGASSLNFSGAVHLKNTLVVGIATDSLGNTTAITPLTVSNTGTFTLPAPTNGATGYTYVLIGLSFTPTLQTLPLDLGEPTVQGKRKKIAGVTVRVKDCLGLNMGRTAATAVPMQDLIVGNVGSMTNAPVTGLVTGDARGYSDPLYDVPGQYVIQQPLPYPGTVLGVIPEIEVGDTSK